MSAEHDDALAEDEAFARVEERDRDRLARRLEAVKTYRFSAPSGAMLRARPGGEVAGVVEALQAKVNALEARIAVLEGRG